MVRPVDGGERFCLRRAVEEVQADGHGERAVGVRAVEAGERVAQKADAVVADQDAHSGVHDRVQEVVAGGRVLERRAQQDVGDDAGDERAADPGGEGPAEEHV